MKNIYLYIQAFDCIPSMINIEKNKHTYNVKVDGYFTVKTHKENRQHEDKQKPKRENKSRATCKDVSC